jgi:TBC1 domain family member 10
VLRQKFENERGLPSLPNFFVQPPAENRSESRSIVVEDDEVLLVQNDVVPEITREEIASSPSSGSSSPEVGANWFPGPLRVANRTPSPSPSTSIATPLPKGQDRSDKSGLSHVPSPPMRPAAPAILEMSQLEVSSQDFLQLQASAPQSVPGPRKSLFLPHPNAPKPAPIPSEPMYIRRALEQQLHGPPRIPESRAINVIYLAIAGQRGPPNSTHACTIYGRCDKDLANSTGPVPITFTMEPPVTGPAQAPTGKVESTALRRPATASSVTPSVQGASFISTPSTPVNILSFPDRAAAPSIPVSQGIPTQLSEATPPASVTSASSIASRVAEVAGPGNVIPRSNFTPKVQTVRPRSRSFSGFQTASPLGTNGVGQKSVLIAI